MLYEEHLLLKTVVNNHLDTCSLVKNEAEKIRVFLQNALPDFQKSKVPVRTQCSVMMACISMLFCLNYLPNVQDKLDRHLLGSCEDIITDVIALHPFGVTGEMEEDVNDNFKLVNTFEKELSVFSGHGSVKILLGHFQDLFAKVQ